jgi:hypothetical protein
MGLSNDAAIGRTGAKVSATAWWSASLIAMTAGSIRIVAGPDIQTGSILFARPPTLSKTAAVALFPALWYDSFNFPQLIFMVTGLRDRHLPDDQRHVGPPQIMDVLQHHDGHSIHEKDSR